MSVDSPLARPWGLAVLRDGRRLVCDPTRDYLAAFRTDGTYIGDIGTGSIRFTGSYDIASHPSGGIVCAKWGTDDDPRYGYLVLGPDFRIRQSVLFDEGAAPGRFQKPMGIHTHPDGRILIADTFNHRVQIFSDGGRFLSVVGEGELRLPMKAVFGPKDHVYIADSGNNRVAVYGPQPDGTYKHTRDLKHPLRIKEPCSVAVDNHGHVFVSTCRVSGVYMFDSTGEVAWHWPLAKDEKLSGPRGLAFDGRGHLILVDEASRRVLSTRLI